jgi:hypothetical protein
MEVNDARQDGETWRYDMPTIRAVYSATIKVDLVISRDFYLNKEYQLARALYERLLSMEEDGAIDFLLGHIVDVGEGQEAGPELAE